MSRSHMRDLGRLAAKYGYTVTQGGKHLKLVRDGHPTVVAAKSPSCHRAMQNIEMYLKRATNRSAIDSAATWKTESW